MKTLKQLQYKGFFTLENDILLYFIKSDYNKSTKRFHCKAFFKKDHKRYSHADVHLKSSNKVQPYKI